jgi:hypothetical protein
MSTVAPDYTVDGLVTSVFTKYLVPNSQSTYQPADITLFLDEELRSYIIPFFERAQSGYWLTRFDQAITGAASYTIPKRSTYGTLYDVVFVDTNGNEIGLTDLSTVQIKGTFPFGFQLPLYTFGYYIEDDQVFLYPQQAINATQYTLRMRFYRRPNNLTLMANCAQITAISGSVVTVNAVPATWATTDTFDVIQNFPQFKSISDGLAITLISNLNITLASVPTGLAVGMWLCPTGMSCIPQIPYDAFPLLVQRGIIRAAESLGDTQSAQIAEKRLEKMEADVRVTIQPRVTKGEKKVVNRNQPYNWGILGTPFLR